jgi:hypothetical protein
MFRGEPMRLGPTLLYVHVLCIARELASQKGRRKLQVRPESTPFKGLERAIYSGLRILFGQSEPVEAIVLYLPSNITLR